MIELYKNITIIDNKLNVKTGMDLVIKNEIISFVGFNYNEKYDILINADNLVCCPNLFNLNFSDKSNYGWFNLENISKQNLNNQLISFKNNNLMPIMFIENVIDNVNSFETLVPFIKKHNITLIIKVGSTLNEMGLCDKLFNETPVELLESYGLLDLQPIILSATNLDKSDFEILSLYNATICLTFLEDLLKGNGIPSVLTMQKNNLNIIFSSLINNTFKEMFLCYTVPSGVLNLPNAISSKDVLKMATTNAQNFSNSNFAVGEKANCTILEFKNVKEDVITQIVLEGEENKVFAYYVNGKKEKNKCV